MTKSLSGEESPLIELPGHLQEFFGDLPACAIQISQKRCIVACSFDRRRSAIRQRDAGLSWLAVLSNTSMQSDSFLCSCGRNADGSNQGFDAMNGAARDTESSAESGRVSNSSLGHLIVDRSRWYVATLSACNASSLRLKNGERSSPTSATRSSQHRVLTQVQ